MQDNAITVYIIKENNEYYIFLSKLMMGFAGLSSLVTTSCAEYVPQ